MATLIVITPSQHERLRYFYFLDEAEKAEVGYIFYEKDTFASERLPKFKSKPTVVVNGNRLPDIIIVKIAQLSHYDVVILQHGMNVSNLFNIKTMTKLIRQFPKYIAWIIGSGYACYKLVRMARTFPPEEAVGQCGAITVLAFTNDYLEYWSQRAPHAEVELLPLPDPTTYGAEKGIGTSLKTWVGDCAIFVDELFNETYGLDFREIVVQAQTQAAIIGLELLVKLHPRSSGSKYKCRHNMQKMALARNHKY
jgi:hypothetical protein